MKGGWGAVAPDPGEEAGEGEEPPDGSHALMLPDARSAAAWGEGDDDGEERQEREAESMEREAEGVGRARRKRGHVWQGWCQG